MADPLSYNDAMEYVKSCIGYDHKIKDEIGQNPSAHFRKFRTYAVSDFGQFIASISPIASITPAEYAKAWARFLVYNRCGLMCNSSTRETVAYYYVHPSYASKPQDKACGPRVLLPTHTPAEEYMKAENDWRIRKAGRVTVTGVGECNHFATQAYLQLSSKSAFRTGVPRVEKVTCGIHNLVRVNYPDPRDDIFGGAVADLTDTIFIDYWLLALGCPLDRCICRWEHAAKHFRGEPKVVESHNPQDRR